MMKGLDRVSSFLRVYKLREELYLDGGSQVPDFRDCVVSLYSSMLEYQIRMYLYLSHSSFARFARDVIKKDGWSAYLNGIEGLNQRCLSFTDLIDTEKEQQYQGAQLAVLQRQASVQEEIRRVLSMIQSQQQEVHQDEVVMRCLHALSSDYEGQKNLNETRVANTCQWFLDDGRFKMWRDSKSSSILWVTADPGCGKSVLARSLVDEDLLSSSILASTTCYFFFKDGLEAQSKAQNALSAILHQIATKSPNADLLEHIVPSYRFHGEKLLRMYDELWRLLMLVASDSRTGELVCLIDALDECEEQSRESLLKSLVNFYANVSSCNQARLKFIITSRGYGNIDSWFFQLSSNSAYIRFSGEDESPRIKQEILMVIRDRVPQVLPRLSRADRDRVILLLGSNEQRTYLWLYLVFRQLRKSTYTTFTQVKSAISRELPDLKTTYETLLRRSPEPTHATLILRLVLAAHRPLHVQELHVAAELANDDKIHFSYDDFEIDTDDNLATRFRDLCGLLIFVHDYQVYLLHQTVREYLLDIEGSSYEDRQCDVVDLHILMADVCVKHLLLDDFSTHDFELDLLDCGSEEEGSVEFELRVLDGHEDFGAYIGQLDHRISIWINKYAFLTYSSQHWYKHFQASEDRMSNSLVEKGARLISVNTPRCQIWFLLARLDKKYDNAEYYTDLIIAARLGLRSIVELMLDRGANVNECIPLEMEYNVMYLTPLQAAAALERESIVRLLIQKGAAVNPMGDPGHNGPPLYAAAGNGAMNIVQILLEYGADPDIQGGAYDTPLGVAAACCEEAVFKLLLDVGADINACRGSAFRGSLTADDSSAAWWCIRNGAKMRTTDYPEILMAAAKWQDYGLLNLLLETDRGAVHAGGVGALEAALVSRSTNMTHILLALGVNANGRAELGTGTLLQALMYSDQNVFAILEETHRRHPLLRHVKLKARRYFVSQWYHESRRFEFRQKRTRTNASEGEASLLACAELLLTHGADPNLNLRYSGETCLQLAVMSRDRGLVEAILRAGANPNSINPYTRDTALKIALDWQEEDIATILRAHNATEEGDLRDTDDDWTEWQSFYEDLSDESRDDENISNDEMDGVVFETASP